MLVVRFGCKDYLVFRDDCFQEFIELKKEVDIDIADGNNVYLKIVAEFMTDPEIEIVPSITCTMSPNWKEICFLFESTFLKEMF